MSKKENNEAYKITFSLKDFKKVMPDEIRLVENQLGELVKQIMREDEQED